MNFAIIAVASLFSIFSTAIMSYISLVIPIGPWVELILVLVATIIFRLFFGYQSTAHGTEAAGRLKMALGLTTVAGGVGGIVATVCGFVVPTFYFLEPEKFMAWLSNPWSFIAGMGMSVMVGGLLAFFMVQNVQERLLVSRTLVFPIGTMVSKVIAAQNQLRKSLELFTGMLLTMIFGFLQLFTGLIPLAVKVFSRSSMFGIALPEIILRLDVLPIFIAIGYVAGALLTVPLAVGMFAKIFLFLPLQLFYFEHLSALNFILAVGSGMVVQAALTSFFYLPQQFSLLYSRLIVFRDSNVAWRDCVSLRFILTCVGLAFVVAYYLRYFAFSWYAVAYIVVFTIVCVYQLLIIGGKVGIAPFGRFGTFVMLPGMFFFGFNAVQVTVVSLLVGLAGGIAVDCMFGRKMAQISGIEQKKIFWFQLLGLVISAATVGVVFMVLIKRFGLGSEELIAQRAQARALLVNAYDLDYGAVLLGMIFGFLLRWLRISSLLVFTGLLFPAQFSLMLIAGGLLTLIPYDKEEWDPFWSGVFAAGSLLMILRVII